MGEKNTGWITVKIDPEQKKQFVAIAAETGINPSSVVRNLIYKYIQKMKK